MSLTPVEKLGPFSSIRSSCTGHASSHWAGLRYGNLGRFAFRMADRKGLKPAPVTLQSWRQDFSTCQGISHFEGSDGIEVCFIYSRLGKKVSINVKFWIACWYWQSRRGCATPICEKKFYYLIFLDQTLSSPVELNQNQWKSRFSNALTRSFFHEARKVSLVSIVNQLTSVLHIW